MSHLPWLLDRKNEEGGEPCGHALMASCPPGPFSNLPNKNVPFGSAHACPQQGQTWELTKGDLATLLDLSRRLDLDGEITPVVSKSSHVSRDYTLIGAVNVHGGPLPKLLHTVVFT